jgi:plasmid maintenance system killer protein
MEIRFASGKFAREANDSRQLVRTYGDRRAKLIRRRLDELRAAESLADLRNLPGPRCHELRGDRKGQISVDLDHPYRLLFTPAEPVLYRTDGGLDWDRIESVVILGVEDTHD